MSPDKPDPAEQPGQNTPSSLPVAVEQPEKLKDTLSRYLALSLSLPERTARAVGAGGGGTLLLTRTLVPEALKSSNSYRFTLGMFQTFLIRNVAGVDHVPQDMELKDHFMQRKALGTSLEAAGLLTMHFSPVWVFAIASDAAEGGRVFLQRLVHHLKENGVIAGDSHPESLEQILRSIHDMGRQGATAIDTPPLSRDEINEMADELRRSTASLVDNSSNLLPRFESIWNQIGLVAKKENLSVAQVMGMLSVNAAGLARTGVGAAGAVGKTGYHFLDEVLITDYRNTLAGISEEGAYSYMKNHMRPFLENAQSHFDFKRETWTQRWLRKTMGRIRGKPRG